MRSITAMALVLLALAGVPGPGHAADCSEGPGDADGDGLCDAHDACAGFAVSVRLREVSLTLRKLGGRDADDTLRFRAIVPLAPGTEVDPPATGLRVVVLDGAWASEDVMLDVAAPAGAGWATTAGGRSWTYRSTDAATTGIKRAIVKKVEPNPAYLAPQALAVSIDARRGTYDTTSDLESHFLSLAFAGIGVADVCAERPFYPWLFTGLPGVEPWEALPWQPSCRFRSSGRTLECSTGPRVGPCRVSTPGDMMVCDAQNAAAAQQQYREATGAYYTGSCSNLPGFSPSPDVTCMATGNATAFTVTTSHADPSQWYACTWDSQAAAHLGCS